MQVQVLKIQYFFEKFLHCICIIEAELLLLLSIETTLNVMWEVTAGSQMAGIF